MMPQMLMIMVLLCISNSLFLSRSSLWIIPTLSDFLCRKLSQVPSLFYRSSSLLIRHSLHPLWFHCHSHLLSYTRIDLSNSSWIYIPFLVRHGEGNCTIPWSDRNIRYDICIPMCIEVRTMTLHNKRRYSRTSMCSLWWSLIRSWRLFGMALLSRRHCPLGRLR